MTPNPRPRKVSLLIDYALLFYRRPMSETHSTDPVLQKLESVRRSLDLRLDEQGRWWHDGVAFEHPRIIEAFNRGIERHPDTNEPIVRVGERWCYFHAELTPFFVRRMTIQNEELRVLLNTGEKVFVPENGLFSREERIYVRFIDGREAVLDRQTQLGMSGLINPDGESLAIGSGARVWKIVDESSVTD